MQFIIRSKYATQTLEVFFFYWLLVSFSSDFFYSSIHSLSVKTMLQLGMRKPQTAFAAATMRW